MGGSTKVSFHASSEAQFSMTSEWFGANKRGRPNRERHIEKWKWQKPTGDQANHIFRILVPDTELRSIERPEDLEGVTWIPSPGEGKMVQVDCFVSPRTADTAPAGIQGFLCALELDDTASIVVFFNFTAVAPEMSIHIDEARAKMVQLSHSLGLEVKETFRSVAGFADEQGVHGMVEFVPSPTA